jgi:hypothetical protein
MKTTLEAFGIEPFSLQGSRFWYVEGDYDIEVKLSRGGDTRIYRLKSGQGVNWENERFDSLEIRSLGNAHDVEFEVLEKEVFDNRIPGSMTVVPEGGEMPVVSGSTPLNVAQSGAFAVAPEGGEMPVVSGSAPLNVAQSGTVTVAPEGGAMSTSEKGLSNYSSYYGSVGDSLATGYNPAFATKRILVWCNSGELIIEGGARLKPGDGAIEMKKIFGGGSGSLGLKSVLGTSTYSVIAEG